MIKSNLKIGFVFVNYNNSLITRNLISSLKTQDLQSKQSIVIVDNLSDKNNIEVLRQIDVDNDNVVVIYSNENLGYFRALNCGLAYLKNNLKDVEIFVIGNNDLFFPNDFLSNVSSNLELLDLYPVISPNIVTSNGEYQNPHVIRKISFIRELVYDLYYLNRYLAYMILKLSKMTKKVSDRSDESQHEIAQLIYQGHGSCYILGPLFFENFDDLFAPTFLFGEEFFLSYQLNSKGFQVYYEPKIKIIHECHSTISKMPSEKMWRIGKVAHKEYRKYIKMSNLYKLKM